MQLTLCDLTYLYLKMTYVSHSLWENKPSILRQEEVHCLPSHPVAQDVVF